MQKLQLYIEGTRVELFKDENVSLTQTIQNVKDIKKIFTEFTQSFSVPASKTNNKLFKHFYNIDIDNGFDSRRKKSATIELNGIPFKVGKIKLNGVNLKNNLAHTYRITFFGNTVDMKDILGDDQLSSLGSLGVYNQLYTYDEVLDGLNDYMSGSNNNVLVPLITHTDRMFLDSLVTSSQYTNVYFNTDIDYAENGINWNQFKYALRVQTIIEAIQAEYTDIQFSNDFFNDVTNDEFNDLFLWLHRKKGMVESPSNVAGFVESQVNDLNTNTYGGDQELQPIMGSSYGVMTIGNTEPDTHWTLDLYLTPQTSQLSVPYSVTITRNNTVYSYASQAGAKTISLPDDESGTYTISIGSSTPITFPAGNIYWYASISQRGDDGSSIITGWQKLENTLQFITSSDLEFNIIEQIPKMTIMQFLTGLFQMFNLTAYVDEAGLIIIKTLDSYYAASSEIYNIDQYLDVKTSVVDAALPFKEVTFSYKGLGTLLAKKYEQIWNAGWGSERFTLNDEIYDAPSESYAIELPFEHMMYERLINENGGANTTIQYGYFVDDNLESYFGSPLLFYPIRQYGEGTRFITIRSTVEPVTKVPLANYFIPSNSVALDPLTSKSNIHFNVMINEWTATSEFTDTLFETKYRTYIQDVFNPKRRLTKVTAYLPMNIFLNLKLNDIIELGQSNYLINSLKTNLNTGKTQFELLNTII